MSAGADAGGARRARRVEAVLWDVGGVFTTRPVDAVERVAARLGVDPEALFAAVFGPYHLDTDHPWHRLERGEVALADAWVAIGERVADLGVDLGLEEFFAGFADEGPARDRSVVTATVDAVARAGVVQAVVTNNVREFGGTEGRGWRRLVPVEHMVAVVDSSLVGVRKPDPAIYELALGRLGVEPERAVFVDDTPANVEAARRLGLVGVLVGSDPAGAMAEVRDLVGVVGA